MARLPFLLSIVHGGYVLPRELAPRLAVTAADIFYDANPWTREVFAMGELVQGRLEVEVARAVIDLDRDPSVKPHLAPDGIVRTVTRYNKPVWVEGGEPTQEEISRLVERYHRPYHEILERTASRGGVRMGIDCHSMGPIGAPNDPDPGQVRPMFCLGNMGDSEGNGEWTTCDVSVLQAFSEALHEEYGDLELEPGQELVSFNAPFSGGYVLKRHRRDRYGRGTPWVGFTINRQLVFRNEPEEPANADSVPDSDREVIGKVRLRVLSALKRFAEKVAR